MIRLASLLLGLLLPACGRGTDGVPPPPPMDMHAIVRPASPNTALAAPEGFAPAPDIVTPTYSMPAPALFAAAMAMARRQTRTYLLAEYPDRLQAHFVARSAIFGFPDLVAIQAEPAPGGSRLIVYSRSVYGYSDLGVNRKRVAAWLAALGEGTAG